MAENLGGIYYDIEARTEGLLKGERQLRRSTRNMEGDLDRTSKAADRTRFAMKRMAAAIGSVIVIQQVTRAVNATVQSFADFERGMIGVGKTTDITGRELVALGQGIREVSKEVPVSTERLLGLAQAAGQLGVSGSDDILRFTKTLGQLELATDLVGEEGARSLARLLNITGDSVSDIDRLGSSITELGNNFATTEAEIVKTATYLGPSTQQFNLTSAEVVGLSAALRSLGQRAETSGSAVGAAMTEIDTAIADGGASMETLISLTGKSADQLEKSFRDDATGVLLDFAEAMNRLPTAEQTKILDQFNLAGRETRRVIGALASNTNMARDAIASSSREWERNVALAKEAAVASKSFSAQMQLTANVADEAASAIGAIIAPALLDGMHSFRDAAILVADNIDEIKEVATVLAGLLGARLAASLATVAVGFGRGQIEAIKYQAALARMAGVSRTAAAGQVALAGSLRAARGALALLGGPTGVIFMAAAALTMYVTRADDAKKSSDILAQSTDGLTKAKARLARLDTEEALAAEERRLADLEQQIDRATARWMEFGDGANSNKRAQKELGAEIERMRAELASGEEDVDSLRERLSRLSDIMAGEAPESADETSEGIDDVAESARNAISPVQAVMDQLNREYRGIKPGDDPFAETGGRTPDEPEGPRDPGNIGLTNLQQLRENAQREMQILQENYEAKELSEVEFQERMANVAQTYADRRLEIMGEEKAGMMAALEEVGFSFDSLANRGVGALAQVATGMRDGEEAAKSFAQSALTELLGALIRMGIQAITAQTTQAAAAQATGAAITAAYAPAAIAANIASFGGASIAAASAAPAAAAGTMAAIQSGRLGAGRLNGGPVNPGTIYPVTEDGNPELLMQGGKQFLLPGSRGEVVSNKNMTEHNSGGNITVQQTFQGGNGMDAQQLRNMVFDSNVQDAIYNVMQRQNAKRGRKL